MHHFHCKRQELKDPKTDRTVWQLTDGHFECSATYMDKTCTSDVSGNCQVYVVPFDD